VGTPRLTRVSIGRSSVRSSMQSSSSSSIYAVASRIRRTNTLCGHASHRKSVFFACYIDDDDRILYSLRPSKTFELPHTHTHTHNHTHNPEKKKNQKEKDTKKTDRPTENPRYSSWKLTSFFDRMANTTNIARAVV
jgi:hypothetical protein